MRATLLTIRILHALVLLWVDLRWAVAPARAERSMRRRFAQLPPSAQRILLERHGKTSL